MGGAVRRPPNGWQEAIKSYSGVVIQPSSNLFYQKFLKKASARRLRRRAEKPDGSRAKNFLP